jgi:hypothetical protein
VPERLDRIHFEIGDRQVEMPSSVGEALKAHALKASSTQWLVSRMEAACASKPVEVVDAGEMLTFIELLEHWTRSAGDQTPDSVRELRGALRDALHNRRRGT